MPRLEEVVYYLRGLWLLFRDKPEAFSYLDLTDRGFWRSWWSVLYCLPPALVSYVAFKQLNLPGLAIPTQMSLSLYAKLAVVDYGSMVITTILFFGVARLGGFGQFAAPIVTVTNWLSVPTNWTYSFFNLLQIYVPDSLQFAGMMQIAYLLTYTFVSYRLINRIVGGHTLATVAALLTLFIVPMLAQQKIWDLIFV